MRKLSINEAAKRFDVSRPTLLKHLKEGKISGEKSDGKGWEIDAAELARAYQARPSKEIPEIGKTEKPLHEELPTLSMPLQPDLQAEIERLKAEVEVEREKRQLVERHLEDLRRLLPSPSTERPAERGFWARLLGR